MQCYKEQKGKRPGKQRANPANQSQSEQHQQSTGKQFDSWALVWLLRERLRNAIRLPIRAVG